MTPSPSKLARMAADKLNGRSPLKIGHGQVTVDPRSSHPTHDGGGEIKLRFSRQIRAIEPGSFWLAINGVLRARTDTLYEAKALAAHPDMPRGLASITWEFGKVKNRVGQSKGERVVLMRDTSDDRSRGWRVLSEYDHGNIERLGLPRVYFRGSSSRNMDRRHSRRVHACVEVHAAHWQETFRQQVGEPRGDRDVSRQDSGDCEGAQGDGAGQAV